MNALQFQEKLINLQDNMMNFALTLTSNRDDAQDLLQDTTLKVLGNREKFTDNVNFKGWVLTIMRNIFINDYHKAVRAQSVIDQDADVYNVDILNDSGFDTPDGSIQIQEITGAINHLNEELRVPFSLYVSGYKYNEIADKLDMPLGTIKSRIFFARQELQKQLKDFQQD
jgi:RNA polymerase sigma-70 factor (ECF subfamily)